MGRMDSGGMGMGGMNAQGMQMMSGMRAHMDSMIPDVSPADAGDDGHARTDDVARMMEQRRTSGPTRARGGMK
jgi:hypothetical protein